MDKPTAREVTRLAQIALGSLNDALLAAQASTQPAEFEQFKKTIGAIMGAIVIDVLQPLYAEHPDITPPELK